MHNICVRIVGVDDPAAKRAESDLDAAHFPLPLSSRPSWGRHFGVHDHKLVIAENSDGRVLSAIGLERTRTRALPGHWILRVHALGDAYAGPIGTALLAEIARYGTEQSRVLRIVVEAECRAESARDLLGSTFVSLGFRKVRADRIPANTLALDLLGDEESIFASFSNSARKNIREVSRLGMSLVPLSDSVYSVCMNALLAGTVARTGGQSSGNDWGPVLGICRELPHRSRLVGVFRGPGREPEDLLAYAWGVHHGERAIYHTSASARIPGVRVPLLYPALWDLIKWAKREGASWFDLGGVTAGTGDSNDALGRISDFKRRFSRNEIALGEEWIYEPSPMKAAIARFASNLAHRGRRRNR